MGEAFNIVARSKDPSTQVGARIVSVDNRPLGTGYNGVPRRIQDNLINWSRPYKYPFIRHAEVNAIKHSHGDTRGATIYVTAPPCSSCMLAIVDAEIDRCVYFPAPRSKEDGSMIRNHEDWEITRMIAEYGNVLLEEFSGDLSWMLNHVNHLMEIGIFDAERMNRGASGK